MQGFNGLQCVKITIVSITIPSNYKISIVYITIPSNYKEQVL